LAIDSASRVLTPSQACPKSSSPEPYWVQHSSLTKSELIAQILREFEEAGDAMRYLNPGGQIAWKATPEMLIRLADAEREAEDDLADCP
jgi:hypothetical protein